MDYYAATIKKLKFCYGAEEKPCWTSSCICIKYKCIALLVLHIVKLIDCVNVLMSHVECILITLYCIYTILYLK